MRFGDVFEAAAQSLPLWGRYRRRRGKRYEGVFANIPLSSRSACHLSHCGSVTSEGKPSTGRFPKTPRSFRLRLRYPKGKALGSQVRCGNVETKKPALSFAPAFYSFSLYKVFEGCGGLFSKSPPRFRFSFSRSLLSPPAATPSKKERFCKPFFTFSMVSDAWDGNLRP